MAEIIAVKEVDFVSVESVERQLIEGSGDNIGIVEIQPQIIEAKSTAIEIVETNTPENIIYTSDPISFISDAVGGGSGVDIYDEGGLVAKGVTALNFVGNQVLAKNNRNGSVSVFIPQPSYVSHFNTTDGVNECLVSDTAVANRFISAPTVEGTPFKIGDWVPNRIHQALATSVVIYQTSNPCSILNEITTFTVDIFDETGSSLLTTYTTPQLSTNGVHTSVDNAIIITVSGWNSDVDKYQAQIQILINLAILLPNGGRFGVSIQHNNSTDGTFVKVQNHLFYDTNTQAATIGNTTITQKWAVSSKYLSGIRYYTIGDVFAIGNYGLDNINSNSYPAIVVASNCTDFGIDDIQLGTEALQNWSEAWNHQDAYYEGDHSITRQNMRFIGDAKITTGVMDWGIAKTVESDFSKVLIDTYPQSSTDLLENFEDEYYRQDSGFNYGLAYGNWLGDQPLQQGDAMVFGGRLIAPSEAHTIDNKPVEKISTWYNYLPLNESGNQNPDYSTLTCPINYYRTFLVGDLGREVPNWQMYIEGDFVNGNVNADIENGLIEIYIRRMGSTMTENVGPTATPMTVHGIGYSYGDFDDGVTNGCIRTGNSAGSMIGCTSGGLTTTIGIHFHIRILDPAIKIQSILLEFN